MSTTINNKLSTRICKCVKLELDQCEDKLNPHTETNLSPNVKVPKAGRNWFYADEYATIYNMPTPTLTSNINIAVVSFGGGLYGTLAGDGTLTNSDCHSYWASIGILPQNMPKIVVKPINGASNLPNVNDGGATHENTLDVQMIGACCPSSNLTIILYIIPNSLSNFPVLINHILNVSTYKPFAISISWGAPEVYYPTSLLNSINTLLSAAVTSGVNVTAASGDNGSNNGVGGSGSYADFPASCPNVIGCGGTNLVCPNLVYDNQTVETAWSSGGGALSGYFSKPTYQNSLNVVRRSVPDIAMNADPATGVAFLVNNSLYIFGGTSVVSPAVAGYLAAVGPTANKFLNTILYTAPSTIFNDVLLGSNGAFTASTGYDNCSGLGSIKGGPLKTLIDNTTSTPSPPTPPTPSPPSPPSPSPATVNVSSVSLNITSITLRRGQTFQLVATVLPTNATNKSVIWSSSNPRTATVTKAGLIRAVNIGSNVITVRTVNQNKRTTINVTVTR